jgi:hypothetical protein
MPETRSILDAPGLVRRECVLALAWALLGGEKVRYGHPWENQYLLAVVARKPAPLTLTDLDALVAAGEGVRLGYVGPEMTIERLTPQFRHLYQQSGAADRLKIGALIERAAALCHYGKNKRRLTEIVARDQSKDPWETIDARDDVGPRLRNTLKACGEAPVRVRELLLLARAAPASGKPSKSWNARAANLRSQLADPDRLASAVLTAVLEARDVEIEEKYGGRPFKQVRFFAGDNEGLVCSLITFVSSLRLDSVLGDLRRLATKSLAGPNGSERSLRLANACVRAIADTGSDVAIRELVALQRTMTHGGVLVRFFRGRTDDPVELAEVLVSEVMRDVDLFISVTSIGADPDWLDRKEGRRFEKYWAEISFGPLAAAGEVRRELLAELLPRLAIADRCEFDDAYLVVTGDLRTYRIHLGSGLARMSPTGAQLRIPSPPNQRAAALLLPIDDDPILVRILASALTLAKDSEVSDQKLARLIRGR